MKFDIIAHMNKVTAHESGESMLSICGVYGIKWQQFDSNDEA